MRVLLTGGSGFLGRHIVAAARQAGHEILSPSHQAFDLETMRGIEDYLRPFMRRGECFDAMIHAAAYYGGIGINEKEPATIIAKNARMALNIFEIARKYEIRKILPVGSACSYPGQVEGDLKEEQFWEGRLHPTVQAYGFSKKLLLVTAEAYYRQHGIESVHPILTNLYGPYDVFTEYRSHVLASLIKKFTDAREKVTLWGDGKGVREFLYVEDAADAILRALSLPHDLLPINIGTGVGTSIAELADLISRMTKFHGKVEWDTAKPGGTARKVLDVSRMKAKLNWFPRWTLADGLSQTIEWYVAHKTEADQRT